MKIIKKCRKALAVLFVLLLVGFQTGLMDAVATDLTDAEQNKIESYKKQQAELEDKIADNKEKMEALKDDIAQQEAYIDSLKVQIRNYQSEINILNDKIAVLEGQKAEIQAVIDELSAQIDEINTQINHNELEQISLQQEIDDTYEELKERLCNIYVYGKTSELELLLNSTDFESFLITLELSSNIAEHDNAIVTGLKDKIAGIDVLNEQHMKLIEEIEATQAEHQLQIDALNAKEEDIMSNRADLQASQNEIMALEQEAAVYLSELDSESAAYKALNAQYEADIEAFNSRIEAIIEEARQRNAPVTFTPSGGLICPLQYGGTYISSSYGYRSDPATGASRFHGGVDLCVSGGTYGKSICAAANGTVLTAACTYSGYGFYVLLDHGNGLYTLYAHNSELLVSTGQTVSQGQTIARAGQTGYATGAHCHFEVRVNGERVNPMGYISLP